MCCIVASDLAAAAFDAIFMRLCVFGESEAGDSDQF